VDGLLRDADAARHHAKERGRGRVELFDPGVHARALSSLEDEQALRRALPAGELVLHYQPVFDSRAGAATTTRAESAIDVTGAPGRVVGAEALMRWNHPEHGLLGPYRFIPLAEETGLIVSLGAAALRQACATAAGWSADGSGVAPWVAVNLSARQLTQPDLVDQVRETLEATGLAPSRLCLEITESVLMAEAEASEAVLSALRELGVSLAIDDFGTGYSSLAYLRRYPVDKLKIDRSFIEGLGAGDGDARTIVAAVLGLAHALGLEPVAEGVEDQAQREALGRLGCHVMQGFALGRPVPAGLLAAEAHDGRFMATGRRVVQLPDPRVEGHSRGR
jgi:EAL domain-containing protein (putative c-di-GMP-specific phosphodiesterase class I)